MYAIRSTQILLNVFDEQSICIDECRTRNAQMLTFDPLLLSYIKTLFLFFFFEYFDLKVSILTFL